MFWMPWRTHCFTDPEERACAASTLLRHFASRGGHRHLLLRHRRFFGAHAGDLLAREVELDGIDAVFDQHADGAPHLLGPRDDDAEIEALMGNVRGRAVAEAADRGDLRTGGECSADRGCMPELMTRCG